MNCHNGCFHAPCYHASLLSRFHGKPALGIVLHDTHTTLATHTQLSVMSLGPSQTNAEQNGSRKELKPRVEELQAGALAPTRWGLGAPSGGLFLSLDEWRGSWSTWRTSLLPQTDENLESLFVTRTHLGHALERSAGGMARISIQVNEVSCLVWEKVRTLPGLSRTGLTGQPAADEARTKGRSPLRATNADAVAAE